MSYLALFTNSIRYLPRLVCFPVRLRHFPLTLHCVYLLFPFLLSLLLAPIPSQYIHKLISTCRVNPGLLNSSKLVANIDSDHTSPAIHRCREWVARCLGQMTDANRTEAQAELRQVIADAFAAHSLWTTDWEGVQLKRYLPATTFAIQCFCLARSLAPKPPLNFSHLKRKTCVHFESFNRIILNFWPFLFQCI